MADRLRKYEDALTNFFAEMSVDTRVLPKESVIVAVRLGGSVPENMVL